MRLTRRSTLRSLLTFCLSSELLAGEIQSAATDDEQTPDPMFFAQLQRLVRPALIDISSGRALKAISSIEQARALMETAERRNWIFWFYVNQPYGLALILLGKHQDAIEPLKVAVDIDRRMRASRNLKIQLLVKGLEDGMVKQLLRVEFARQALSNLEKTGKQIHDFKDLLLDQSTGTMDSHVLLVRAYAANGNFAEAAALLAPQIQSATATYSHLEQPVALEYRLIKMGASLCGAGDKADAARAFDSALDLNLNRLRNTGEFVASPESQLATYSVRRLLLSADLGNVDFAKQSNVEALGLLHKIVETKGLGIRYAERFNRLLRMSHSPVAEQVRQQLQAIDAEFAKSPDGLVELSQLFFLAEQRWKAVSPVMAELRASGLGDVFMDGKTILANARKALGNGALLGYMAYTPLSSDKFAFGSPRYLRYCVTDTDIQLADVGTKVIADKAVFRLRELILTGQPAHQIANELSHLLLSDLPKSAKESTSWTIEPDGALNLLPFETLPASNGHPLIFTVDIGYVTSFGQVSHKTARPHAGKARIIADPEFNNPHDASLKSNRSGRGLVRVAQKGEAVDLMGVPSLPETRLEAAAVERALRKLGVESETFLGKRADVHSLEMTESPRVLHVATHGILIPLPLLPAENNSDPLSRSETYGMGLPGRNAGLAMSGDDKPVLVYAADIARLPLQSTELVVLSACDSGNGTVDVGEGMASLRRAVETAGASASVTSLWSVPSEETTKLMSSFYGYLATGNGKRAALRQAKLDSFARNPNPYNWAGFVFAGQE